MVIHELDALTAYLVSRRAGGGTYTGARNLARRLLAQEKREAPARSEERLRPGRPELVTAGQAVRED